MSSPESPHPDSSGHGPVNVSEGRWLMFTKFLERGRVIASVAPSSRFMARAILRDINFETARCIVELGAGTGPITAELLKRAGKNCRCLIVELDHDLCRHLRKRFPHADIVEGDACDLDRLLDHRKIDKVDHILSGLPLPSIPEEIRDRILDVCARRLTPDGSFRQLTVMPWIYYRMYRRYFQDVRFRFVPMNFPPGGVYVCKGYQERDEKLAGE
jgi:phospholipid N-methyltransferase